MNIIYIFIISAVLSFICYVNLNKKQIIKSNNKLNVRMYDHLE